MNETFDVAIAGGGPAGMMAGLLFARAGVKTVVLEKHQDFLRDFRGDTVHPATLEIFNQLGLLEELLKIPHDRVVRIGGRIMGQMINVADFRYLQVAAPYIAMMPQWDLLDFINRQASQYAGFTLKQQSEVSDVIRSDDSRVAGIRLKNGTEIRAKLVIAADGRRSVLRAKAGLPLEEIGAPMDVFWFRVPKNRSDATDSFGIFENGRIMILIDRADYWQVAFVFPKGQEKILRSQGLDAFKDTLLETAPVLASGLNELRSWDDIKTLNVALDRLTRWHVPGLLAIGDAAHAMSPIGGVGINLAIQDAVAAANVLAGPMSRGEMPDPLLQKVQDRRWKAATRMQWLQKTGQDRLIDPLISGNTATQTPPWPLKLLNAIPLLQRIPGRIIGLGFGREKVESPDVREL